MSSGSAPVPRYDLTSDLTGIGRVERPQTVETIIERGYFAVPRGDAETAILSDKQHTSRLGLDDVIDQVRHRYAIFDRNTYEIELAKCRAISDLFAREAETGGPADSRQQYTLTRQLLELYEQQRTERVLLWKDISKLRQDLPENAQQYLSAYRKMAVLKDDARDAP